MYFFRMLKVYYARAPAEAAGPLWSVPARGWPWEPADPGVSPSSAMSSPKGSYWSVTDTQSPLPDFRWEASYKPPRTLPSSPNPRKSYLELRHVTPFFRT